MTPTPRWPGPGQRWPPLVRTTQSLSSRETYAAARLYASASALAAFASPAAWAARSASHRPSGHHAASGRTAAASSAQPRRLGQCPSALACAHYRPLQPVVRRHPGPGRERLACCHAQERRGRQSCLREYGPRQTTAQSGTHQMFSIRLNHALQRRDHAVGACHHDSASGLDSSAPTPCVATATTSASY